MDEEQKLKKLFTEQDFRESENGNSEILAQKKKSLHNPLQKQEMALQSYPTTKKTSATFIQELLAIK